MTELLLWEVDKTDVKSPEYLTNSVLGHDQAPFKADGNWCMLHTWMQSVTARQDLTYALI